LTLPPPKPEDAGKYVDPSNFEQFPDVPELAGFDPSDRKCVAVAFASQHRPEILNAIDTDW
jgi:hypothetical protein